jgi:hypothetical protein
LDELLIEKHLTHESTHITVQKNETFRTLDARLLEQLRLVTTVANQFSAAQLEHNRTKIAELAKVITFNYK